MSTGTIFCVCRSDAIRYAARYLSEAGMSVTQKAAPDVSHVLLPVPAFTAGDEYLAHILADLPDNAVICGGNLSSPLLKTYTTVDFLHDPLYLAQNAAITADCACEILKRERAASHAACRILVVGWGRIGKCLCRLLEKEGASVTVAARKETDRAMISALGCRGISIKKAAEEISQFDIVINTVPAMVLPDITPKDNAIVMELASSPGVSGGSILSCRGLPGKMAPAASGQLIADTFLRLIKEV